MPKLISHTLSFCLGIFLTCVFFSFFDTDGTPLAPVAPKAPLAVAPVAKARRLPTPPKKEKAPPVVSAAAEGKTFPRTRRPEEMLSLLEQELSKNPSNSDLLEQMGLLYANDLGNREKGIEFLEKAVLANPHSRNLSELVNQYASGPDWKRGVTFLESLPESPLTQSTLGDLYLRVGHYKESIEHLEKAKTPGEAPDPRLGQAYFLSGNLNKAIQVDTERKEKSAGNEERKKLAGIDLADKYVRVGEVDKAIKEVEDVLALDPHNQEAVTRLEEFRRLRTKSSAE